MTQLNECVSIPQKSALALKRARRSIGDHVQVSEAGERFNRTKGFVSEVVPAFGTILYKVKANRIFEYGQERVVENWECLFFADQLRAAHQAQPSQKSKSIRAIKDSLVNR